jgi:hypothetical protein
LGVQQFVNLVLGSRQDVRVVDRNYTRLVGYSDSPSLKIFVWLSPFSSANEIH